MDALLTERERMSLRWSMRTRLASYLGVIMFVLPFAGNPDERVWLVALVMPLIALGGWALHGLRREVPRLQSAAFLGATTDAALVVLVPVLWYNIYASEGLPLIHLTHHNYTAFCAGLIGLNALSLRPLFPALIAAVAAGSHVVLAWIGITDGRLADFNGGWAAAAGAGIGPNDALIIKPFFIVLTGVFVAMATRAARTTVLEAVALEQSERELRERQLEAVLDARMSALGELVAGVEHEVNNPLGAMRSATDTATRAVRRLREALASATGSVQDAKAEKMLTAVESALALSEEGGERVAGVMRTIKGFVQLDAAELQRVDLAETIEKVLRVVRSGFRSDVDVLTDFGEGFFVEADPRRLNQAFATVFKNAGEAFDGPGTLNIDLSRDDDEVVIRVADHGRGMSQERINGLFGVEFASSARVHARFGLPLCRSILRRHGGDIAVVSTPGEGTTVTMRLPAL